MSLISLLLLLSLPFAQAPVRQQDALTGPGDPQQVMTISFDGREFTRAFNRAAEVPRVVMIFSPT